MASRRRSSALANVVNRRASFGGHETDLTNLVRVYLLDGSSKVFQMSQESTAEETLSQLKYNLDLQDISTYALFRVMDKQIRRIELSEKIKEVLLDLTESGHEVRILFRSWITAKCGGFEKQVFQDNTRHKEANTALWLSFMEASFMCFAGKYYLSEEESMLLGCIKMQADSGDFNPEIHTVENMKLRIASRFPNPVRSKMRALMSPTLAGSGLGDAVAYKVQHLYARVAGKHKAEAQIEFLYTLRTWCPFYGATFFSVQCQFDDGQSHEEPPVTSVNAAIGPLAIFLITQQEPPMILRHPYKRILKWIAYKDKHIFHYWVIKSHLKISDIEAAQAQHNEQGCAHEEFNPQVFCDCVYLVLPSCAELEYLVRSYVNLLRDIYPKLRGAKGELLPGGGKKRRPSLAGSNGQLTSTTHELKSPEERDSIPEKPHKKRTNRFEKLFQAIGAGPDDTDSPHGSPHNSTSASGNNRRKSFKARRRSLAAGSGIDADSENDDAPGYGDDSALVSKSLFQSIYNLTRNSIHTADSSGDDAEPQIPAQIKFAASMSELQRMALEERFSDEDSDGTKSSDEGPVTFKTKFSSPTTPQVPTEGAFARVSKILFGSNSAPATRNDQRDSSDGEEEESSDEDD